jgi:site-specific DNA-methyltransferase (adenine-specific)
MANALYYGDNLYYLREMPSESIDLIYLDPPFNSKATYNLLFHSPEGAAVEAQTAAFKDTWHWDTPAEEAFSDVLAYWRLARKLPACSKQCAPFRARPTSWRTSP